MKTAFLITARLKSKRLPKKIILKVMGKPLIVHMIDRIKHAKNVNKIILCTSTNPQDDPLEKIALTQSIECYRGSEDDVLMRLLCAAKEYNLEFFANITADVPMIDPALIDQGIDEYIHIKPDLVIPPVGYVGACNVVKVKALESVCKQKDISDTEVWVRYFEKFHASIYTIKLDTKYRHMALKTCLDYPEDYEFIQKVFGELYDPIKPFSSLDIIDLVDRRPDLLDVNSNPNHLQRWIGHNKRILNL